MSKCSTVETVYIYCRLDTDKEQVLDLFTVTMLWLVPAFDGQEKVSIIHVASSQSFLCTTSVTGCLRARCPTRNQFEENPSGCTELPKQGHNLDNMENCYFLW